MGNNAGLRSESCAGTAHSDQSQDPGRYQLANFFQECDLKKQFDTSLNEPGNVIRNGYGNALGCNIDDDSKLRNNSEMTNPRLKHPLHERPYLTVPYMGKGVSDTDLESLLRSGYQTDQKKPCNVLADVSIMPERMVFAMYNSPQQVEHVVWNSGYFCGSDSRNDIRRVKLERKKCS